MQFESTHYIQVFNLAGIVFFLGLLSAVLNRKNMIVTILSLELLLLGVNLNFFGASAYLDDTLGQSFILFVLAIAAVETAIGLALLAAYYRLGHSIEIESVNFEGIHLNKKLKTRVKVIVTSYGEKKILTENDKK